MRLIITGTPGTGKTTLASAIAKQLGCTHVDAGALAIKLGLGKKAGGEFEVDLARLKKELAKGLKGKKDFVAEGHLLCEFSIPCDAAVVLRCNPVELEKRLKRRKYSAAKLRENVLAEMLDYCLIKAEGHYKTVVQVDATRKVSAAGVLKAVETRRGDSVNWAPLLLSKRFSPMAVGRAHRLTQ